MKARIRLAQVGRAAVLLFAASCGGDDEPIVNPAIASVEILPHRVSVIAGMSFTVRARVRDKWGNALPDQRAAGVRWSSPAGLSVPVGASNAISITGAPGTAPLPFDATLTASIDGHSNTATITIIPNAPVGGANVDWVAGDFDVKDPPTIALVTAVEAGTGGASPIPRFDTTIAFVSRGTLGSFGCFDAPAKCGDVVVFPPRHAPVRVSIDWTSSCDFVSLVQALTIPSGCRSTSPPPQLPLKDPVLVPVYIWKASSAWGLDGHITKDLDHARRVIEQVWSGLKLDVKIKATFAMGIVRGPTCQSGDEYDVTKQLAGIPATEFKKDRITVVYVQGISYPDPAVPGGSIPTGELAYTCEYVVSEGTVILIDGGGRGTTHLAHEFGHALGQWPGSPAHPDWLGGFDPSNLMWSEETDAYRATRENLKLGQWFQMTLAQSAFIRRAGLADPVADPCQPEFASDAFCPWLGKDISK